MSYVSAQMIAESGESGAAWFRRGLANLLTRSTPEQLAIIHPESGLMQGQFADAYDSSRALLLDELLPSHAEFGSYVAVPSRDHLLVLPISADSAPLAPWLRAIAGKTYGDMPYAISPELYWVHAGVWRPIAISIEGDEVVIRPPAEFVEMIDRLRSASRADSPQNDSESLPN
jgi:hypothetical protein